MAAESATRIESIILLVAGIACSLVVIGAIAGVLYMLLEANAKRHGDRFFFAGPPHYERLQTNRRYLETSRGRRS